MKRGDCRLSMIKRDLSNLTTKSKAWTLDGSCFKQTTCTKTFFSFFFWTVKIKYELYKLILRHYW